MKKTILTSFFLFFLIISGTSFAQAQTVTYREGEVFEINKRNLVYAYLLRSLDGDYRPMFYDWERISGDFTLIGLSDDRATVTPSKEGEIKFRYHAVYPDGKTVTIIFVCTAVRELSGGGSGNQKHFEGRRL